MIKWNFNTLSPAGFLAQAESIVASMTGNADFPEPWPGNVPSLTQIRTELDAFQTELLATTAGDKTRIVARNAARSTLANDLTQLAFYVQTVAQGDDTKLATSGYPLRKPLTRTQVFELPSAPSQLTLGRGVVSGMLVVRAGRVPGAGSYDVQITAGDPTVEANWAAAGSYKTCRRMELQGLTPGKVYSVRVRALGTAGPGAWTAPSSLMVV